MNNKPMKVLKARACYGHLGGTLGNRLFERMIELGWIERDGDKLTVYSLTEHGIKALLELGVDIYERR
jgi:predicted transcriptional regulator